MKIHEREQRLKKAIDAIKKEMADAVYREDLTTFEALVVVNEAASDYIDSLASYHVRQERGGDDED